MSLRLAILQHERETGLGRFEALMDAAGVTYDVVTSTREPLPDAGRSPRSSTTRTSATGRQRKSAGGCSSFPR